MFTNGMGKIRVIVRRPSPEPATVAITTSLLASATALVHSARCRWNRNTPFFSSVVWCTCSSSQLQYRKNAFTSFSAGSLFFSRVRLEMNEIWGATTASAALTSSAVRESLRSLSSSPSTAPANGPRMIPTGGKRKNPAKTPAVAPMAPERDPPKRRVIHAGRK